MVDISKGGRPANLIFGHCWLTHFSSSLAATIKMVSIYVYTQYHRQTESRYTILLFLFLKAPMGALFLGWQCVSRLSAHAHLNCTVDLLPIMARTPSFFLYLSSLFTSSLFGGRKTENPTEELTYAIHLLVVCKNYTPIPIAQFYKEGKKFRQIGPTRYVMSIVGRFMC